jgi:mannobiose 2-epimerase
MNMQIKPNMGNKNAQQPASMAESLSNLSELASSMETDLVNHIIPFWLALKDEKGGFYGRVDFNGEVDKQADKGALLNSRILWFFARSASELKHEAEVSQQCFNAAQHAYVFLTKRLTDPVAGGLYWSVDYLGRPLDTQKHIYNQAFAIYALSEWYAVTKDALVLEQIHRLFSLIESHARDTTNKGYFEAFDKDWQAISNDLVCDTEDIVSVKSMNTHLHIMEAYSRLYDVSPLPEVKQALQELVGIMVNQAQNERFSFYPFFDEAWNVQSKNHSYGHDIEGSWLIWDAAEKVFGGKELERVKHVILSMADRVLTTGTDFDGAVCNEWVDNKYVEATRVWWVQAEAIVGFSNAWLLSGDQRYLEAAARTWQVIDSSILDAKTGEWHLEVDRWGVVDTGLPKASFWKCPYHNGRACLEMISRVRKLR